MGSSPLATALYAVLMLGLTVLGTTMAVTGRRLGKDYPKWPREGWPLRSLGIAFAVLGVAMIRFNLSDGVRWDAVVIGYFFAFVVLWSLYGRRLAGRLRF